jgi:hypothetical protein
VRIRREHLTEDGKRGENTIIVRKTASCGRAAITFYVTFRHEWVRRAPIASVNNTDTQLPLCGVNAAGGARILPPRNHRLVPPPPPSAVQNTDNYKKQREKKTATICCDQRSTIKNKHFVASVLGQYIGVSDGGVGICDQFMRYENNKLLNVIPKNDCNHESQK